MITHIDEAFIRRFDYLLEVKEPRLSKRRGIIEFHAANLPVSGAWLDRIASNPNIAPGVMVRATRVAKSIGINDQQAVQLSTQNL